RALGVDADLVQTPLIIGDGEVLRETIADDAKLDESRIMHVRNLENGDGWQHPVFQAIDHGTAAAAPQCVMAIHIATPLFRDLQNAHIHATRRHLSQYPLRIGMGWQGDRGLCVEPRGSRKEEKSARPTMR